MHDPASFAHHSHDARFRQRRSLLAAATGAIALAAAKPLRAAVLPWERGEPEGLGVANDLGARLDEGVKSGELDNLHAVFVVRRGKLAVERYYQGTDERWGTPLGTVAFNAATLHDLRSVSKSIVGLLYGIALGEGKVPALDMPVLESFPQYKDLARDKRRHGIRISHVLSMTMGLDWNEELPYTDPRNSDYAMERTFDRYRYVLERPIAASPGQSWRYSGGSTAILGHLIVKGTGMSLLDFARARLFAPVDIDVAEWTPGLNAEPAAASGLRLRAPDLARVGQLMLQQGRWGDRQIIPSDWVTACVTPRIATPFEAIQYGYQWWVVRRRDGHLAHVAMGLGGQRLAVVPALDLVYVIFMGNYYRANQLKPLLAVQGLINASLR
jgi:CubicO group peptidase (beta-lactamase class C family)